jgi:hypothetical protein
MKNTQTEWPLSNLHCDIGCNFLHALAPCYWHARAKASAYPHPAPADGNPMIGNIFKSNNNTIPDRFQIARSAFQMSATDPANVFQAIKTKATTSWHIPMHLSTLHL